MKTYCFYGLPQLKIILNFAFVFQCFVAHFFTEIYIKGFYKHILLCYKRNCTQAD